MQPPVGGGFGFPPGPPPKKVEKRENRASDRNLFGTEFPWAQGDLTANGKALKKIGVRYAGDATYFASARGVKRPLKLDFTRFEKRDLHGLAAVHLHSMPLDPAKAREAIAYAVFRDAGVPAPRTAFAEVTLTVPGRFDKEYLGLYTVVEDVDQRFLADRFGSDHGLLMRWPGCAVSISWATTGSGTRAEYQPQAEPTKEGETTRRLRPARQPGRRRGVPGADRLVPRRRCVPAVPGGQRPRVEPGELLCPGAQLLLYLRPKTNKFVFLLRPRFSFANFLLMGTADQLTDLSLRCTRTRGKQAARPASRHQGHEREVSKILRELTANVFTKERLMKDADAIDKATKAIRDKEAKAAAARKLPPGFGPPGFTPQPPDVKAFAEADRGRGHQLARKSKGYVRSSRSVRRPERGGPGAY